MNKKEIAQIKKKYNSEESTITRMCGCYVDAEKNIKMTVKENFLTLEEEETVRFLEIFRKTLTGTVGKTLLDLEFPREQEGEGTWQEFLLALKDSQLEDDSLLEAFYEKIIENYVTDAGYLILLIHDSYDVPGRSSDGMELFDASEEVYEYLLCSICPMSMSKAALYYSQDANRIIRNTQEQMVGMPDMGFLFPKFTDNSSDVHGILCYTRNAAKIPQTMIEELFGCRAPLSARDQKDSFNTLVENTLGKDCSYDTVMTIHEKLNEIIEDQKDEPEPVALTKPEVKRLLASSGASEEQLEDFDEQYAMAAGSQPSLMAANIANTKKMEIKTGDIVVNLDPAKASLIETRDVDGRKCLVIPMDGELEINGIHVKQG